MPIVFCASRNALAACLAQLPTSTVCGSVRCDEQLPAQESLPHCSVLLLEGSPSISSSYHSALAAAVSTLANDGRTVVLAPDLLAAFAPLWLMLPAAAHGSRDSAKPFGVQTRPISSPGELLPQWDTLLPQGMERLLVLDGDVSAWCEPAQARLSVHGAGSVLALTRLPGPLPPISIVVDVLVNGMSRRW